MKSTNGLNFAFGADGDESIAKAVALPNQFYFGMDGRGRWRLNRFSMKMKLCLIGIFGFVALAVAEPHTWLLKNGSSVNGDYFSSGTTAVVLKRNGTNYFLKISDLSTNELTYLAEMQFAQRLARLDAEAKQLAAQGFIEVNAQLLENFPGKVNFRKAWMDCTFLEFTPYTAAGDTAPDVTLVLEVTDKDGNLYTHCETYKSLSDDNFVTSRPNPVAQGLSNLKHGDKIRLIGVAHNPGTGYHSLEIQGFEMIESAAEKKAKKEAKRAAEENLPDTLPPLDANIGLPK